MTGLMGEVMTLAIWAAVVAVWGIGALILGWQWRHPRAAVWPAIAVAGGAAQLVIWMRALVRWGRYWRDQWFS